VAGGDSHALPAGRVGRPHGLDGSFYVTGPRPRLLELGAIVSVAALEAPIIRRAGTDARPIIRLRGIDDRAAAEALRGNELTVASASAPELADGEWWAHELEGCAVVDGERGVGVVSRMIELPSCEALEVSPGPKLPPLLIPMVRDAIRAIDTAARRIEVNLDFLNLSEREAPGGDRTDGHPEDGSGGDRTYGHPTDGPGGVRPGPETGAGPGGRA
jgi:16S rRNA processing protein RimM